MRNSFCSCFYTHGRSSWALTVEYVLLASLSTSSLEWKSYLPPEANHLICTLYNFYFIPVQTYHVCEGSSLEHPHRSHWTSWSLALWVDKTRYSIPNATCKIGRKVSQIWGGIFAQNELSLPFLSRIKYKEKSHSSREHDTVTHEKTLSATLKGLELFISTHHEPPFPPSSMHPLGLFVPFLGSPHKWLCHVVDWSGTPFLTHTVHLSTFIIGRLLTFQQHENHSRASWDTEVEAWSLWRVQWAQMHGILQSENWAISAALFIGWCSTDMCSSVDGIVSSHEGSPGGGAQALRVWVLEKHAVRGKVVQVGRDDVLIVPGDIIITCGEEMLNEWMKTEVDFRRENKLFSTMNTVVLVAVVVTFVGVASPPKQKWPLKPPQNEKSLPKSSARMNTMLGLMLLALLVARDIAKKIIWGSIVIAPASIDVRCKLTLTLGKSPKNLFESTQQV